MAMRAGSDSASSSADQRCHEVGPSMRETPERRVLPTGECGTEKVDRERNAAGRQKGPGRTTRPRRLGRPTVAAAPHSFVRLRLDAVAEGARTAWHRELRA